MRCDLCAGDCGAGVAYAHRVRVRVCAHGVCVVVGAETVDGMCERVCGYDEHCVLTSDVPIVSHCAAVARERSVAVDVCACAAMRFSIVLLL